MRLLAHSFLDKIGFTFFFMLFSIWVGAQKDSLGNEYLQEDQVKLTAPKIELEKVFFKNQTSVSYEKAPEFCSLYYSLKNGQDLGWNEAPKGGFLLKKSGTLSLKYKGNNRYIDSDPISFQVLQISDQIISKIELNTKPSSQYLGEGSLTLIDQKKGTLDFKNGQWLGFNKSEITLGVSLMKKTCIKKLTISALQDQGAWIFLPYKIEVYDRDELIGTQEYSNSGVKADSKAVFLEISLIKSKTSEIKIRIIPLEGIPDWHPGQGTTPWFFIDEIIIE